MLDSKAKQKVIVKFAIHQGDTGSTQVQVAILTEEINRLSEHLQLHKKDNSSRRGLLGKIGERRRLLRYLASESLQSYEDLVKKLKLKRRDFQEKKMEDPTEDIVIPSDIKDAEDA